MRTIDPTRTYEFLLRSSHSREWSNFARIYELQLLILNTSQKNARRPIQRRREVNNLGGVPDIVPRVILKGVTDLETSYCWLGVSCVDERFCGSLCVMLC